MICILILVIFLTFVIIHVFSCSNCCAYIESMISTCGAHKAVLEIATLEICETGFSQDKLVQSKEKKGNIFSTS